MTSTDSAASPKMSDAIFVIIAIVASLIALPTEEAAALDVNAEFCGYNPDFRPKFSGNEWNAAHTSGQTMKELWTDGIESWSQINDINGAEIFTLDGREFEIDYVSSWMIGGSGAVAICGANPLRAVVGGEKIAVNVNNKANHRNSDAAIQRGFAAHEWGHVMGFGHAGKSDATHNGVPTMSTCLTTSAEFSQRDTLSSDDVAVALASTNDIGEYQIVTPNTSFEESSFFDGWTKRNASVASLFSPPVQYFRDGKNAGNRSVRISANRQDRSPYILASTRVTKMDERQTLGGGVNLTPQITVNRDRVRGNLVGRKLAATDTGSVWLRVSTRAIDLPAGGGATDSCNFYTDDKNGNPLNIGPWVTKTTVCQLGTSWGGCTTNTFQITRQKAGFRDLDAAEVKVLVYNRVYRSNGQRASVDIARAAAEVDFDV